MVRTSKFGYAEVWPTFGLILPELRLKLTIFGRSSMFDFYVIILGSGGSTFNQGIVRPVRSSVFVRSTTI